jgi:hypothetical protein
MLAPSRALFPQVPQPTAPATFFALTFAVAALYLQARKEAESEGWRPDIIINTLAGEDQVPTEQQERHANQLIEDIRLQALIASEETQVQPLQSPERVSPSSD